MREFRALSLSLKTTEMEAIMVLPSLNYDYLYISKTFCIQYVRAAMIWPNPLSFINVMQSYVIMYLYINKTVKHF